MLTGIYIYWRSECSEHSHSQVIKIEICDIYLVCAIKPEVVQLDGSAYGLQSRRSILALGFFPLSLAEEPGGPRRLRPPPTPQIYFLPPLPRFLQIYIGWVLF